MYILFYFILLYIGVIYCIHKNTQICVGPILCIYNYDNGGLRGYQCVERGRGRVSDSGYDDSHFYFCDHFQYYWGNNQRKFDLARRIQKIIHHSQLIPQKKKCKPENVQEGELFIMNYVLNIYSGRNKIYICTVFRTRIYFFYFIY